MTTKSDYHIFGDGDGSAPELKSIGHGPIRWIDLMPIEKVRRTYGDGSGEIRTSYHAPLCEGFYCQGCGPKAGLDHDYHV